MTGTSTTSATEHFLRALEFGVAAIDDMSTIRHLHASSARLLGAGMLSEPEITAFSQHIYSESYSARVAEVVLAGRLSTARLGGELIATAGWTPANDSGGVARLIGVFVSPLHAGQGVGRKLVHAAEAQARQAGFAVFTIRTLLGASGFFEHLGYQVASHGVWPMNRQIALPVAFLRKESSVAISRPAPRPKS